MTYMPKSAVYMPSSATPYTPTPVQEQSQYQESPFVSALRNLGGGGLADATALAQEPGRLVRQMTGNYGMGGEIEPNPFISQQRVEEYGTPVGAAKNIVGDIAGAASWFPALGTGKTLAQKVGQGAVQAGLARMSQDKADVGNVLGSSLFGGALSGGIGIGEKIVPAIGEKISKNLASKYVGLEHANKDFVRKLIHPDIQQTIKNLEIEMENNHSSLSKILSSKKGEYGDFLERLKSVARKQMPSLKSEKNLEQYTRDLESWLENNVRETQLQKSVPLTSEQIKQGITPSLMPSVGREEIRKSNLSLDIFNEIKKTIGKMYDPDHPSLYNDMYNAAKTFIEEKSGKNEAVSFLNNTYNVLRESRNNAKKLLEGRITPTAPPIFEPALDIPAALLGSVAGGIPGAGIVLGGEKLLRTLSRDPYVGTAMANLMKSTKQIPPSIPFALKRLGVSIPGLLTQ